MSYWAGQVQNNSLFFWSPQPPWAAANCIRHSIFFCYLKCVCGFLGSGGSGASPVLASLRGLLNLYFCFINGKLPVGPRICLPGEAFNASVQCNGVWEKKPLSSADRVLQAEPETARPGGEGPGLLVGFWTTPRPPQASVPWPMRGGG